MGDLSRANGLPIVAHRMSTRERERDGGRERGREGGRDGGREREGEGGREREREGPVDGPRQVGGAENEHSVQRVADPLHLPPTFDGQVMSPVLRLWHRAESGFRVWG